MGNRYDAIVCGIGGMGSAACLSLAKRHQRVLGLEQFSRAHANGSSHGKTRLIRKAYFEHPNYVPLLHESYRLWHELEERSSLKLFEKTGLLLVGNRQSPALTGARHSAQQHGLVIEDISHESLRENYPQLAFAPDHEGLFEKEAGFLRVEACVEAQSAAAERLGAELHFHEAVVNFKASDKGVFVETDRDTYEAKTLVVTAGAWTGRLLKALAFPLSVHRQVQFWFSADMTYSLEGGFPCFAFDLPQAFFYGFPFLGPREGMKVASHKVGDWVEDPTQVDRKVKLSDSDPVTEFLRDHLPQVAPKPIDSSVCLYTMTRDTHFLIDRHPKHPSAVIAAGFSGHGFKFCPVVGECLAELSLDGRTKYPIDFLKLR